MSATFTKLKSGEYGIRVTGSAPSAGQSVTVTKKSGETSQVVVSRVIWSGQDKFSPGKVYLCAIEQKARAASRSDENGAYCGFPCPVTGRTCNAQNGPCHDCQ